MTAAAAERASERRSPVVRGHVVEVFEPAAGGVPEYVASLSEGLLGRGWRVTVLAPARTPVLGRLAAAGAEIATFPFRHRPAPSDATAVLRLARLCRSDVDLVHGHSTKASLVAAGASRLSGVPSVYTPHAWAFVGAGSPQAAALYTAFERAMAQTHRAIVAVAEEEGRLAAERGIAAPGAIHVVPTGVPPARSNGGRAAVRARLGIAEDAFVACWIGRRAAQKRPQDLAPLAGRLAAAGVQTVALGYGLEHSAEAAALLSAGGRLAGPAVDPADLVAAADVLVQTSAWEGLSLSILQAMQAGLPVVAYGAGGVAEQVEHGRTGYVVPVGAVDELAGAVIGLAGAPEEARRMGEAARLRAARWFSYDRMLDGVEAVYDAVAGTAAANEDAEKRGVTMTVTEIEPRTAEQPPGETAEDARPAAAETFTGGRGSVVWRAKWWILAAAVAAGAGTYFGSRLIPASYEASALISVTSAPVSGGISDAVVASNDLASQYAQLVDSAPVLTRAKAGLGAEASGLAGAVSAGTVAGQNLVSVRADGSTPTAAQRRANAVADSFVTYITGVNATRAQALISSVKKQLAANASAVTAEELQALRAIANGNATRVDVAGLLGTLGSQKQQLLADVVQNAAAAQPSVDVAVPAEAGTKTQPRPLLYAIVAFFAVALVVAEGFVLARRRSTA